ncbi:MAG: hypothetical protein MK165_05260 [Pirellulaceae bacterium]|nr:hypothetical protein [Pirellulaceae bacterium]
MEHLPKSFRYTGRMACTDYLKKTDFAGYAEFKPWQATGEKILGHPAAWAGSTATGELRPPEQRVQTDVTFFSY